MLPAWATLVVSALLTGALLCFALVLVVLYSRPRQTEDPSKPAAAAEHLEISPEDDPDTPTKTIAFRKTWNAYWDLKERNARWRLRLQRGEKFLAYAIVCIFLAIGTFLWASVPARMSGVWEGSANDTSRETEYRVDTETQPAPAPSRVGPRDPASE